MRRAVMAVVIGAVPVVWGSTGATGAPREQVEPTATVRYVPSTAAGYNAGLRVASMVASQVRPSTFDGDVLIRALGTSITLSFDDLGVPTGTAIPVSVRPIRGDGRWPGAAGCVPVRKPWTVSGFSAGSLLQVSVRGASDEYGSNLVAGQCGGRAVGGTLTATGALWTPYGSTSSTSAYPAARGCSVSTHGLLPRETATCVFTAIGLGGWRASYDGLGAFSGDYVTDVTVTVVRDRARPPYGTTESRYTDECGTDLIRAGDRVTVTIRQYDSGYSQHTLHTGQGEHC